MGGSWPATSSSHAGPSQGGAYHRAMVRDCQLRMDSISRALDHLKLQPGPDEASISHWESSLRDLNRDRFDVSLELERFSAPFARPDGHRISVVLAHIKRLEGCLANFCARFEVHLPMDS